MLCVSCGSREAVLGTATKVINSGYRVVVVTVRLEDKCEVCEDAAAMGIHRQHVREEAAQARHGAVAIRKASQQVRDAAQVLCAEAEVVINWARQLRAKLRRASGEKRD